MIEVRDLTFAYPAQEEEQQQGTVALRNVDLTIEKGSFVAVLGHNGSGKSTLAKHMNAVLLPSGGRVFVAGMDTLDEQQIIAIRRAVGMVFQNPDNQIVANVVEEDVAFGPENLGVPSADIRRRVDEALAAVGMDAFTRHAPHLLSGGQKQRIAIAGIIAMAPQCIVLDEATAMLDPAGRREVLATIETLHREMGITVVLITHHMDEALLADRVVVMNEGRVAMDGTPTEVFTRVEELEEMGLTVPDTVRLLHRLRRNLGHTEARRVLGHEFPRESFIGFSSLGTRIQEHDRHAHRRRFGNAHVARNHGFVNLLPEMIAHFRDNVLRQTGDGIDHREDDAVQFEIGIDAAADALDGTGDERQAVHRQKFRLNRNEDAVGGDERTGHHRRDGRKRFSRRRSAGWQRHHADAVRGPRRGKRQVLPERCPA